MKTLQMQLDRILVWTIRLRPTALTLLAIAESEDPNIVDRAGDMMRIANSYANAGFPLLFSMLDSRGDDTALDYLCDEVEKFVR